MFVLMDDYSQNAVIKVIGVGGGGGWRGQATIVGGLPPPIASLRQRRGTPMNRGRQQVAAHTKGLSVGRRHGPC